MQHVELTRQCEAALMQLEDERSHCLRLVARIKDKETRGKDGQFYAFQSHRKLENEKRIDTQLSQSKPLVTEIMEFFNKRETASRNE